MYESYEQRRELWFALGVQCLPRAMCSLLLGPDCGSHSAFPINIIDAHLICWYAGGVLAVMHFLVSSCVFGWFQVRCFLCIVRVCFSLSYLYRSRCLISSCTSIFATNVLTLPDSACLYVCQFDVLNITDSMLILAVVYMSRELSGSFVILRV